MADITDEATELEELQTAVAIQNHKAKPRLQPKGCCHWCGFETDLVFCHSTCEEDHAKYTRALKFKVTE